MAGPVEEGAKVASSVVDAMRSQPLMLALILMNLIVFLAIFYSIHYQRTLDSDLTKMRVEQAGESQRMLQQCVPLDQLNVIIDRLMRNPLLPGNPPT